MHYLSVKEQPRIGEFAHFCAPTVPAHWARNPELCRAGRMEKQAIRKGNLLRSGEAGIYASLALSMPSTSGISESAYMK